MSILLEIYCDKVYNGIVENLGFPIHNNNGGLYMKSVKELNKIADDASKSVMQTVGAIVDAQSFIESDKFISVFNKINQTPRWSRRLRPRRIHPIDIF